MLRLLEENGPLALRPYQQGALVANWLRKQFADAEARVEPNDVLSEWDVIVEKTDFETPSLDAVAFWAHGSQPHIVYNDSEKHRANQGELRATLAHEICHLLIDRLTALPLSAVTRGAMDKSVEQRANAFAAEFLCPRKLAEAEYLDSQDVPPAIGRLTERFGVSRELAALQLGKSTAINDRRHQSEIEAIGPAGATYRWSR